MAEDNCVLFLSFRRRGRGSGGSSCSSADGSLSSRRKYAALDVGSMGVDLNKGPVTNLDNKLIDESESIR
jgi:hypothetical protein